MTPSIAAPGDSNPSDATAGRYALLPDTDKHHHTTDELYVSCTVCRVSPL